MNRYNSKPGPNPDYRGTWNLTEGVGGSSRFPYIYHKC
jgi:hypothetical protein